MLAIAGRYSSSELRGSIDYWLSDRVESGQVPRQVLGRDGRILVTEWQDEEALVYQLADKFQLFLYLQDLPSAKPVILVRGLALGLTRDPVPDPAPSTIGGDTGVAHLSVLDINGNTVSYIPLPNLQNK
eukprot:sb/3475307/